MKNFNTLDHMLQGIIIIDTHQEAIIFVNQKAREILKYHKTDASPLGEFTKILANPNEYEVIKTRTLEDLKEYNKSEEIIYLKAYDGTTLEVDISCVWEDKENGLISWLIVKSTEVVNRQNIIFKELADQLPSGIIVMDVKNQLSVTYANSEHYKILGVDSEEEVKNDHLLRDFLYEEDAEWVLAEIYTNLVNDENVDIEFRMKTADNGFKWVRLFGRASISSTGEKLFYSSIKDLSERKSINDKLHLERVIFHKLVAMTGETLFKIDLKNNIINFLGRKIDAFNEGDMVSDYPESILNIDCIYKDDISVYDDMLTCFSKGIEKLIELRYKSNNDSTEYEWYRITYGFIKNSDEDPMSVIGKITNIHMQKTLEMQAKNDMLTNFYNKITTQHEVSNLLGFSKKATHAFFIIDVDNFKAINDNLGHLFGDMVLTDIAADIKECFRQNDILGRIGGDEFVVVMRDTGDTSIIISRANMVCKALSKTFVGENGDCYSISASIGIALFPTDGQSFEELYKKADTALYQVKKTTKNAFRQYIDKDNTQLISYTPKATGDTRIQPLLINNTIVYTAFNLLYESNCMESTIEFVLKYVGTAYSVGRCYIYVERPEDDIYYEEYRWLKKPELFGEPQFVTTKQMRDILTVTNQEGIFYTNDIHSISDKKIVKMLEDDHVKSMFLVDSQRADQPHMVFGVEDFQVERVWSEEEIITMLHVARILFNALFMQPRKKLDLK